MWFGIRKIWDKVATNTLQNSVTGTVKWRLERSGCFSVKSAYKLLAGKDEAQHNGWEKLWKIRAPHRCKNFLWLMMRESLLTNFSRCERHLTVDSTCPMCEEESEETIHVFRDCRRVKQLWKKIVPKHRQDTFWNGNLEQWGWRNVRFKTNEDKEWASLFTIICWWIWKRRNLAVFEQKIVSDEEILVSAEAMQRSMNIASRQIAGTSMDKSSEFLVRGGWKPPEDDWIKLNVDGASSHTLNSAACGGLLRNMNGDFLGGFVAKLDEADELSAELWACMLGLELAWDLGYRRVQLDSDSKVAVGLLENEINESHHDFELVMATKRLMDRD